MLVVCSSSFLEAMLYTVRTTHFTKDFEPLPAITCKRNRQIYLQVGLQGQKVQLTCDL